MQLLLPAAHADPHYGPCIYFPKDGGIGNQHTVSLSFVTADDTYGIGDTIVINAHRVGGHGNGAPLAHSRIALETGDVDRFAVWTENSGSHVRYAYTVQPGDYSDDLAYKAQNAMYRGTSPTTNVNNLNCWLSTPGARDYTPSSTPGFGPHQDPPIKSLSFDRRVVIDGIIPRVANVAMAGGAYGAGSQANVTVNFDEPVFAYGPPPSLVLALDGGNRTIPYMDGNETSSLTFNYTVRQGDLADALDYAGTGALVLATNGTIKDTARNNASLALPEPGSPGSLGATSNASITAASGEVDAAGSPLPDGTYPARYRIEVAVNFTEPVVYSGAAPPSLVLNFSGSNRTASYMSGNDTRSLAFEYTVRQSDPQVARLDYAGASALHAGAGGLRDRAGDPIDTALPWQGGAGQLGSSRSIAIDAAAAAYVTGVGSPGGDTAYKFNDTVTIAVDFSVPVAVEGAPALALATDPPRSASYAGGSGTRTLEFNYTVRQDDAAAGLDYAGVLALSLGDGGAIRHAAQGGSGANALLALPAPGGPGSLGHNRDIAVDGTVPAVAGISSMGPNGTYGTGRIVAIAVAFDEPVVVEGSPALRLATVPPRSASYAGGSGTAELAFWYTVQPGDSAPRLEYAGEDALALEGDASAIRDAAGNAARLALPTHESNRSLAASADIEVHGGEVPVIAAAGLLTKTAAPVLDNPLGVAAFEAGNHTYAAVASWTQKGIQLVQIHENGTLSVAKSATDSQAEFGRLDGPEAVGAFDAGDYTYVMVATGGADSADGPGHVVQLIRVHENGTLDAPGTPSWLDAAGGHRLTSPTGVDFLELPGDGESDNRTYAIVVASAHQSWTRGGVQLIRVHDNATLEAAGSINHTAANTTLRGARAVDAFEMAVNSTHTGTYAIAASSQYHPSSRVYYGGGVQLIRVHDNATLEAAGQLAAGSGIELSGAIDVDTFKLSGDRRYAIVAAHEGDAVQLIRVHENGTLEAAGALRDDPYLALDGVRSVSAFEMGGRAYAIAAAKDDGGLQLVRVHENGTLSAAGAVFDGPGFPRLGGVRGIDTLSVGGTTYAFVSSESEDAASLIRLSPASVSSITASPPGGGGKYREGNRFNVTVGFDSPVSVSDPPPSLMLALDGRSGEAEYLEGGGTRDLVFNYTVRPGDSTADGGLEYGAAALVTRGAVSDARGDGPANMRQPWRAIPGYVVPADLVDPGRGPAAASLALLPPGSSGRLGNVTIDAVLPRPAGVAEAEPKGAPYAEGDTVRIAVAFGEPVVLSGPSPSLRLALGGGATAAAEFDRQSDGGSALVFAYDVREDDAADPLDYDGAGALSLPGGGVVEDAAGNPADLTLPFSEGRGLLAGAGIQVDGVVPRVVSVSSPNGSGTYGPGQAISIAVSFGEAVDVTGTPTLALSTSPARSASYVAGTDGDADLEFLYTVRDGDAADRLDYAGRSALSLGDGGAIRDAAGNNAELGLPELGSSNSLHASDVAVNGTTPRDGGPTGGDGDGDRDGSGGMPGGNGGNGDGSGGMPGGNGGNGDGSGGTPGGTPGGNGTIPDAAGNVTLVVGPGGIAGPGNATGGADGLPIILDVRGIGGGADGTATFPADGVVVNASFASVAFPPGVAARSVPSDGMLVVYATNRTPSAAQMQAALSYPGSGPVSAQRVVEVGDEDGRIIFDMPVRISLEGQAGGRAFYIEGGAANGTIAPIDLACAADDTDRVHRQLGGMGECRIDSGGDLVIHTYHLTRFGAAASERGTPPPVVHTCSLRLGSENLAAQARPGGYSGAAEQAVVNTGSQPFARVDLDATPWRISPASGALGPNATSSLPAGATLVSAAGSDAGFAPLPAAGGGAAVAEGLGGGLERPLWFVLNLTGHAQVEGASLVQQVSYTAECAGPTG